MRAPVLLALIPSLALAQLTTSINLMTGESRPLVPQSQKDYRWSAFPVGPVDNVDWTFEPHRTIGRCGCKLTCLAAAADKMIWGVPWYMHRQIESYTEKDVIFTDRSSFTPKYLDDYFNYGPAKTWARGWGFDPRSGGRNCYTGIYPFAATGISADAFQKPMGLTWTELKKGPAAWARVDLNLLRGYPSLVNRLNAAGTGMHFNLIVGWDARKQKYLVFDPMWENWRPAQVPGFGAGTEDQRYQQWMDRVDAILPVEMSKGSIWLRIGDDPEPIELRLTEPSGRRTGFDPATGTTLQENLSAWYEVARSFADPLGLQEPMDPVRSIFVRDPEVGTYGLEVYGTGDGPFRVTVDTSVNSPMQTHATLTGTVTAGAVKRFEIHRPATGTITVEEVPAFFPRAQAGNGIIAYVDEAVAFDGRGSYEIGGTIDSYEWSFGDGASATSAQATHAYATTGTYTARLTVSNAAGLSAVADRSVLVVTPAPGETMRVSTTATGAQADKGSDYAVSSADGRFVAFMSLATNLVPNDTNDMPDIFVKDLTTGAIERVSVATGGVQAASGSTVYGSSKPSISADGRFVAFESDAANLVADGDTVDHVYVHDRSTGMTEAVSRSSDGTLRLGRWPSISGDGRFVAFESTQSVDPAAPAGLRPNIFVRDRQAGTVTWASRTLTGAAPVVDSYGSERPHLSGDGRYVVFTSDASNLVANDVNGTARDVFVRDLVNGTTEFGSLGPNGVSGLSAGASISADGRYVAFYSPSGTFNPADTNGNWDIFVRDRQQATVTQVSVNSLGDLADRVSMNPFISPNGRFVSFYSRGTNLAPNGADVWQVYLHDLQTGETTRVSVSTAGTPGSPELGTQQGAWAPRPANDGSTVYMAMSENLVANDSNRAADIFVRRVASSTSATTPIANLGGPYVGWASSTEVPAGLRFDGSAARDPKGRALTGLWDFGDGTPETQEGLVATHAFTTPGRYTVKLRVSAGTDVSTAAETEVEILDGLPREQVTTFTCAAPGESVPVEGASPAAHAALVESGWDRSAGRLTAAQVTLTLPWGQVTVPTELPAFTFSTRATLPSDLAPGEYTVAVVGGATTTFHVPCEPVANQMPSANAGGPVYSARAGEPVSLDGSASNDPEGAALTYAWDFGDGQTGTGVAPTHVYPAAGDFMVTLVVNDGTFDSPISVDSRSFAMVAVTEAASTDAGVVIDVPPDMPAASTGCGCRVTDSLLGLWAAALIFASRRRGVRARAT